MPPIAGLRQVPSPDVLPDFARRFSVEFTADMAIGPLPVDLRTAVPKRQLEYRAGRYCAEKAIEQLGFPLPQAPVGRRPAGDPDWPEGMAGSITHTGGFASAAVAPASRARSLGIDTEQVARFDSPARIGGHVIRPDEALLGGPGLEPRLRLALVFSAKEAIFKCLYPLVGRHFGFEDARIDEIILESGTFSAGPASLLGPEIGPGLHMEGRFVFEAGYVHTGVWLPPVRG